eukprot:2069361-Prymnesium_polylepis.2
MKVDSRHGRTCGYCGNLAYQRCTVCEANGLGCIYVCGARSARKGECMAKHVAGAPLRHANFKMSEEARLAKAAKRRAQTNGEDEDEARLADDESDEAPIGSPNRQSNRRQRRLEKGAGGGGKLGRNSGGHPAVGWPWFGAGGF